MSQQGSNSCCGRASPADTQSAPLRGEPQPKNDRMKPEHTSTRVFPAAVFLVFLCFYALTAQRDACWQDSGVRQWRILSGDYTGVEGIALSHPLYIGMARAFAHVVPLGAPLFRLNLFSSLGMALALACLALLVRRLTGSLRAAAGAAVLLGLAHMPWWLATITEVYTWSLAALLFELLLLHSLLAAPRPRTLVALALTSGIGLSIHDFALLALPVYLTVAVLLVRRGQLPLRALGWGALAVAVGSAPFLALVVREALARHNVGAAISSALFGEAYVRQVLGLRCETIRFAVPNLCLFLLNFASPCWLLALAGVWVARHRVARPFRSCLLALTAIHAFFFLRYFVADQLLFALPTLALLAIWAGIGFAWLLERDVWRHAARRFLGCVVLPAGLAVAPAVYWGAWQVAAAGDLAPHRARLLPFRSELRYWIVPWKCDEHSAQHFADAAWSQLERGALLYTDGSAAGPLLATAAAAHRPAGVQLISPYDPAPPDVAKLARADPARPFYVVSPVPGYVPASLLEGDFVFARTGVLYRVTLATAAQERGPPAHGTPP